MTARRACIDCSFFLFCNTILCFTLVFFIVWSIFLPQEPIFRITNAFLTQFDFTNTNNTLHYNHELNITIKNQNNKVDIDYDGIQVIANYGKKRFSVLTLDRPFHQGHKNTTILDHVVLQGQQQLLNFRDTEFSQYMVETAASSYSIDVQLALQVKVRYDIFKTRYYQQPGNKIDLLCRSD